MEHESKECRLTIRLTNDEKEMLDEYVNEHNTDASKVIRDYIYKIDYYQQCAKYMGKLIKAEKMNEEAKDFIKKEAKYC